MIKRKKLYYSKTEVKNGLYTNGQEYMTIDKQEYIGPYHKYLNTGEIFTGETYNERTSKVLLPYKREYTNKSIKEYVSSDDQILDHGKVEYYIPSSKYKPGEYVAPISYYPEIKEEDYNKGYINRYFCKKRNDPAYNVIEINESTYDSITTSGPVDGNLYAKTTIKWKISGKVKDVIKHGILVEYGIYDTNKRTVMNSEQTFRGLKNYLTDYLEFGKVK